MRPMVYLLLMGAVAAISVYLLYSRFSMAGRELRSAECGFAIVFYGSPTEEDTPIDYVSAFSRKVSYASTSNGASYRVDCFLFSDPDSFDNDAIDSIIEMMTAGGKYTLISKTDTLVDGIAGREFLIDFNDQDLVLRARMAINGEWLYSIMVIGQRPHIYGKAANKFLATFRFDSPE